MCPTVGVDAMGERLFDENLYFASGETDRDRDRERERESRPTASDTEAVVSECVGEERREGGNDAYDTLLYCTVPYCSAVDYTVLYYIVLYCIVLLVEVELHLRRHFQYMTTHYCIKLSLS